MTRRRLTTATLVVLLLTVPPMHEPANGQSLTADELALKNRRTQQNGIVVGEPKLYDDALLQQMLRAAEAKLATLQLIDQTGISQKIGALAGASQATNSVALTAQTPSLPQVVTTEKGEVSDTVEKATTNVNVEKQTSTVSSKDVTTKLPTTDVVTTASSFAAPATSAAPASLTFPSGFSVSASDILNEQMQLTFEIANLRLLLDGALSDRMFTTKDGLHRVKPRRTIGIPIDIDPDPRYKNAAAIVEVEIERIKTLADSAEPSVTALLPREKTYNVAAIRESNFSLGGGIVTQVVGFGGSWFRGRKTYYIVQDQDTLSGTFEPEAPHRLGVSWQFRPVLGHEYVRSRQTQTFVQVAFPVPFTEGEYAKVHIRTYWRKFDRRHGVMKEIIPGSLSVKRTGWVMPGFAPTIPVIAFNGTHLEDLGGGQMLVTVPGKLLPGTAVRIGNTYLREGSASAQFSQAGVTFVATVADLVNKEVRLVGRDGEETPLVIDRHVPGQTGSGPVREPAPQIKRAAATPIDETTSLVEVELASEPSTLVPEQVLVIGGKVFGYADAPVIRDGKKLSAVVPTTLLQSNPSVAVTALFAPARYRGSADIERVGIRSRTERLVLFERKGDDTRFLLYGTRLKGAKVLVPDGAMVTPIGSPEDEESLAQVTIKTKALEGQKSIVLQRQGERPIFVALPSADAPKKPEPKARERAVAGADEAVFDSEGLGDLTEVQYEGKKLGKVVADDRKSVTVSGLAAAGATSKAGSVTLQFVFGTSKIPAKLEVVTARVETVTK